MGIPPKIESSVNERLAILLEGVKVCDLLLQSSPLKVSGFDFDVGPGGLLLERSTRSAIYGSASLDCECSEGQLALAGYLAGFRWERTSERHP